MPKIDPKKDKAIKTLRDLLPRGATVYTVMTHVSSSGMSRRFKLLIPTVREDTTYIDGAPLKKGMKVYVTPNYQRGKITVINPGDTMATVKLDTNETALIPFDRLQPIKTTKTQTIRDITWLAGDALGWKVNDRNEIIVGGCGMDMGFHTVYSLASVLFAEDRGKSGYGSGDSRLGGYALDQKHL